jgi:oligopeptide/dipeptide ABC transporter ATP-binding protein
MNNTLLEVRDLTVEFRRRRTPLVALDRVSLTMSPGETLGLVGESGSGKTTLALTILGLVPATSGQIRFAGQDLASIPRHARRALGRDLQVVFQDPYSSLNPARTVGQILSEPLLVHETPSRVQLRQRIADMLEQVGLPAGAADRYPSEFSGGQRQRVAIARALIVSPKLVICDEAVSALDLSVQAQILNLLADLQRSSSVGYLFISHDLAVVRYLASRVMVLYAGQVMESGPADAVCTRPLHPYTRALLAAVPSPDPGRARRPASNGSAPRTGVAQPSAGGGLGRARASGGCPYHGRCPIAVERCRTERPELRPVSAATQAACHLLPGGPSPADAAALNGIRPRLADPASPPSTGGTQ